MAEASRGRLLSTCAVLFGLLALSNFLKPFRFGGEQTGFVLLGHRLSGTANTIIGPVFGLYLLIYAAGIWRMQRYAVAMGWGYAAYVVLNLVLFNLTNARPPGAGYIVFGIVYSVIAVGVSAGTAYALSQRQAELR
ncbi:MAG: hypothetical protein HY699_12405 [Deltaproteobacteria bacterium]|nr:hypothetical protein [Deltaproteobacteria bacterium]